MQSVLTPGLPLEELLRPRESSRFAEQLRRQSARSTQSTREGSSEQATRSEQARGHRQAGSSTRSVAEVKSSKLSEFLAEARSIREATGAPPSARRDDADSSHNPQHATTQYFTGMEPAALPGTPTQPLGESAEEHHSSQQPEFSRDQQTLSRGAIPQGLREENNSQTIGVDVPRPQGTIPQGGQEENNWQAIGMDVPRSQGTIPQGLQEYFSQSVVEHAPPGSAQAISPVNTHEENGANHLSAAGHSRISEESLPATIPPQLLKAWEATSAQQQNTRPTNTANVPFQSTDDDSPYHSEQGIIHSEQVIITEELGEEAGQQPGDQSGNVTPSGEASPEAKGAEASPLADIIEDKLKESMQEEEAPSAVQATKLLKRKLAEGDGEGEEQVESQTETQHSAVPPWAQAQQQYANTSQTSEQQAMKREALPVAGNQVAAESAQRTEESHALISPAVERNLSTEGVRSSSADSPESHTSLEQTTSLGRDLSPRAEGPVTRGGTPTATLDTSKPDLSSRLTSYLQQASDSGKALRIRLNPPELGTLQIEVSRQAGQMTARVEVESLQTRALLLEQAHLLRDSLQAQGIRLERFDVELNERMSDSENSRKSTEEDSSRGESNQDRSGKRQHGREREQGKASEDKGTTKTVGPQSAGPNSTADVMDVSV